MKEASITSETVERHLKIKAGSTRSAVMDGKIVRNAKTSKSLEMAVVVLG
jgi:hypothetical protein